jgi:hypothetical protein
MLTYCSDESGDAMEKSIATIISQFSSAGLEGSRIVNTVDCAIPKNVVELMLLTKAN